MTYRLDEASEIRGQTLVSETITLPEHECRGIVDCTLSNGTLRLAQTKGRPLIVRGTFENCDVRAVSPQRNYPLFKASFISCRFNGVFSGCDFGRSHDVERDGSFGAIAACDFTHAVLDGCRFFNVDISTLRLPMWPNIVLIGLLERAQEVTTFAWPGEMGRFMRICADQPASLAASVLHVPSFAGLVACTEDQVRTAFEKFGGLMM